MHVTGQTFPTWVQVGWIYDAIFSERNYFGDTFKMPDWLAKVSNDTLQRLKQFNDLQFTVYAPYRKYIRLRAGVFLKQAIDNFREAEKEAKEEKREKRFFLYGTHDTLVAHVLQAFGLFKGNFAIIK